MIDDGTATGRRPRDDTGSVDAPITTPSRPVGPAAAAAAPEDPAVRYAALACAAAAAAVGADRQVPDLNPATGDYAHHVAETLLEGARKAGLID